MNNLDAKSQTALVTSCCDDIFTRLVTVDVSDDPVAVTMSELNGECFEGVAFRNVILDSVLELDGRKVTAANTLEFIVSKSRRE